ncbi:MAG: hypothetical protein ACREUZ_03370 [Burkholderiales bacterium]
MFRTLRQSAAIVVVALVVSGVFAFEAAAQGWFLRFMERAEAFSSDRWSQYVSAGYHRLEVEGDGDTDLDCFVFDSAGNLLGADRDGTDYCIVTWYQTRGDRLVFRISNLGDVYNRYEFRLR